MKSELVHLFTESLQVSLFSEESGIIRLAWFGPRLTNPDDIRHLIPQAPLLYSTLSDSLANWANASDEYDLCITQADGNLSLELLGESIEHITLDGNREELIVHYRDPIYPVRVDLHIRAHEQENIFTKWAIIEHESTSPLQIHKATSGHLIVQADHYFITGFRGAWGGESRWSEAEIVEGHEIVFSSGTGTRTAQEGTPGFIIAKNKAAEENCGTVIMGALAWEGNYRIQFRHSPYHHLFCSAGWDLTTPYILDPYKQLKTPELILTHSNQGKGEASRCLHRWARRYGLRNGNQERATLLNSWEGVYFQFTEKTIYSMMERTAELGIEIFVLDDGWFGNRFPRNDAKAGLGDWQVNTTKLPHGLQGLIDKAWQLNIRFGIWVEPEMVNPQSELYLNHPDWVIHQPNRTRRTERNQLILDLSNPSVQEFILGTMRDLLRRHPGISYIKWDCNRKISDPGSDFLDKDHQGNLPIDYVRGYEYILENLALEFPDVTFQACSSGGGRADYGTLRYHHEWWTSDNTDAYDRLFMQWSISHFFPAIAMASHVTASPNHQTRRPASLKFRFDTAMSGRLGFELQPCDMDENDLAYSKQVLAEYKRIRHIIQFGDLYRLASPYTHQQIAIMYEYQDKAILFAWLTDKHLTDTHPPLLLQGLDAASRYHLRELTPDTDGLLTDLHNQNVGGDFLMLSGISIHWKHHLQSLCMELVRL